MVEQKDLAVMQASVEGETAERVQMQGMLDRVDQNRALGLAWDSLA